jgi:hypothetical protein
MPPWPLQAEHSRARPWSMPLECASENNLLAAAEAYVKKLRESFSCVWPRRKVGSSGPCIRLLDCAAQPAGESSGAAIAQKSKHRHVQAFRRVWQAMRTCQLNVKCDLCGEVHTRVVKCNERQAGAWEDWVGPPRPRGVAPHRSRAHRVLQRASCYHSNSSVRGTRILQALCQAWHPGAAVHHARPCLRVR